MRLSYNWLQELISKKLPSPKELANVLTMRSFETTAGGDKKEPILEADILPNRAPDCLNHLGVAREIRALLGGQLKYPKRLITSGASQNKFNDKAEVKIEADDLCSRYAGHLITNVKVAVSPVWLKNKLEVCGLRSINNIVDITNYIMLERGQPLHAFDFDKLSVVDDLSLASSPKRRIIIRRAQKGEKFMALDGQEKDLDERDLVIADVDKIIALAGIIGGANTEVDEKTTTVFLEAANFEASQILRSSRRLKLRTESSLRFEKGIDPDLTVGASERALDLIKQLADGQAAAGGFDFYPRKVAAQKVILNLDYLERFLGFKLAPQNIEKIFKALEFGVIKKSAKNWLVSAPTWRLDIVNQQDLAEEIGRFYGYEKLPAILPVGPAAPPQENEELVYEDQWRDSLARAGLTETYNYSFISQADSRLFGFGNRLAELRNPISADFEYLRPSLAANLLKNVKFNLRFFSAKEIKFFEIGKVFSMADKKLREEKRTAGLSLGENGFFELKGILDFAFNELGIGDIWYDDVLSEKETAIAEWTIFHPRRRARIKAGHEIIGYLGEIAPSILKTMRIDERVSFFDLDLDGLIRLVDEEKIYAPPSKYPAIVRDLAILAGGDVKIEQVLNVLETAGGPLVADIDLFDWYDGEGLAEDQKSLAFHIVFQSYERTLTNEEVNRLQEKMIKAAEAEGWEIRK